MGTPKNQYFSLPTGMAQALADATRREGLTSPGAIIRRALAKELDMWDPNRGILPRPRRRAIAKAVGEA